MSHDAIIADPGCLDRLFSEVKERGYRPIGPTVRDDAIVLDELESAAELPVGWTERQEAGSYRLERRQDAARFGHTVGPQSFKRYLFPPKLKLWGANRVDAGFEVERNDSELPRYAFIGVRPCELKALEIQDRVFMGERHVDPNYAGLRDHAFIVTVNCAEAAATCFCSSMDSGPRAEAGFDLALTEMIDGSRHEILIEAGSDKGHELAGALGGRAANAEEIERAREVSAKTAGSMERRVETEGLHDELMDNLNHPRWDEVAERCLACANCTMVCPTCFCSDVEDVSDLSGDHSERWRHWDSCFTAAHSYIHGGNMRPTIRSRYRQWLTHKFATWIDQFGTSGCTGCGRCITWCPAAIDLTEELAAIRAVAKP
ncbi:MAG TPA: sulfite reductase subunit A [Nannocystis exedens]|nr:sulfite reductase subunit A [Nannocystis exedens]